MTSVYNPARLKPMRFLTSPFAVLLLFFLCSCFGNSARAGADVPNSPAYQRIAAETAHQMMQSLNDFVLLDVRSVQEFREGHISGSILIPVYELERRAASELPDKNIAIFVYCRAGIRASNAARILAEKSYSQVFNFGGIVDWPYGTVVQ